MQRPEKISPPNTHPNDRTESDKLRLGDWILSKKQLAQGTTLGLLAHFFFAEDPGPPLWTRIAQIVKWIGGGLLGVWALHVTGITSEQTGRRSRSVDNPNAGSSDQTADHRGSNDSIVEAPCRGEEDRSWTERVEPTVPHQRR